MYRATYRTACARTCREEDLLHVVSYVPLSVPKSRQSRHPHNRHKAQADVRDDGCESIQYGSVDIFVQIHVKMGVLLRLVHVRIAQVDVMLEPEKWDLHKVCVRACV